ncbi:MAG: GNAT family N-acetyltransferase [Chitinophagaceae bacterium]
MDIVIRTIQQSDNKALAVIIRNSLAEFGANHPGTVYYDPTTDSLYELFQTKGSIYFVAEGNGEVLGGAGLFRSDGLPEGMVELVKMYLLPKARGIGLGKLLIEKVILFAKESSYKKIYIETMPELKQAMKVYEKFGFRYLNGPMGNTGHSGCSVWMLLELQ